jgi:hypothetical protein
MTMTQPFFERLEHIRSAISAGPTVCDFTRDVKPFLKEDASAAYFYEALQDTGWLDVLSRAGQFSEIPPSEMDPETGTVRFRAWPASQYLARMASTAPDRVLEIILRIPDTDNPRIAVDIMAAAKEMPTDLAVKLAPRLKYWIETTVRAFRNREHGVG